MNALEAVTICYLDSGKKKKCKAPIDDNDTLQGCVGTDCPNFIHLSCYKPMLDHFSVPKEDRPDPETGSLLLFCKKGCCNDWKAEKKRVAKAKAKEAKEAAALNKNKNKKTFALWW